MQYLDALEILRTTLIKMGLSATHSEMICKSAQSQQMKHGDEGKENIMPDYCSDPASFIDRSLHWEITIEGYAYWLDMKAEVIYYQQKVSEGVPYVLGSRMKNLTGKMPEFTKPPVCRVEIYD